MDNYDNKFTQVLSIADLRTTHRCFHDKTQMLSIYTLADTRGDVYELITTYQKDASHIVYCRGQLTYQINAIKGFY